MVLRLIQRASWFLCDSGSGKNWMSRPLDGALAFWGNAILVFSLVAIGCAQETGSMVGKESVSPTAEEPGTTANSLVSDIRSTFRIKYVAQSVAYLDGGRNAGLAEGVKLVVREAPDGSTTTKNVTAQQENSANS